MHSKSIGVAALSPPNRALEEHEAWAFQTPVLVLSPWAPAKYALCWETPGATAPAP